MRFSDFLLTLVCKSVIKALRKPKPSNSLKGKTLKVQIIKEYGYDEALFGTGLSFGITSDIDLMCQFTRSTAFPRMAHVGQKLAPKDGGHNKFLEMITVWLDIDAPRYWWSEADTYRCGMTKLSESTIHTVTKRHLTVDDFEAKVIDLDYLEKINSVIDTGNMYLVKQMLPESFLQRRIVCTNYKSLKNIYFQRRNHRLPEWHIFCDVLKDDLEHFELIENPSE